MGDTFSSLHPAINFFYFVIVLLITMLFMHPILLAISLISATLYALYLKGASGMRGTFLMLLPVLVLTAVINPLFNHAGMTVLWQSGAGNPITLESVAFGIGAAVMFVAVFLWFSSYNQIMTSDKFIYLFGKIIPALSLVFSMALRFVPRFTRKIKDISAAQEMIGQGVSSGGLRNRLRHGMRIFSMTVSWALESAVIMSDSMNSRGYGLKGRTAYSLYTMERRDTVAFGMLTLAFLMFVVSFSTGHLYMRYFPSLRVNQLSLVSLLGYIAYGAFCMFPLLINWKEDIVWLYLKSNR